MEKHRKRSRGPRTAEVRATWLQEGILEELNRSPLPPAQKLETDIRHVLGGTGDENTKEAAVLTLGTPNRPSYVVAYTIPWCAVCSQSWLGVFTSQLSQDYRLTAAAADPLPNRPLALLPLPPQQTDQVRFALFGEAYGDPHHRMTVILYSLQHNDLKALWSRADLAEGRIALENGRLLLTYRTGIDTPGRPPSKERTEVYSMTPSGLKLEKATETTTPM
jgi:hypothetical protein